jgi:hypothetical protein
MVPVLSKQHTSTRPANGILNGSVQNIARALNQHTELNRKGLTERTILRQRDQARVDGQTQLHRQLGRYDARDNKNTIQQQFALLQIPLDA